MNTLVPEQNLGPSVAFAISDAASRAAARHGIPSHDPAAYALTLLYEHFHLLALDVARRAGLEHALKIAVGVGRDAGGAATITYGLVDPLTGQRAVVVFGDETEMLYANVPVQTRRALRECVAQGRVTQARECARVLTEECLRPHVQTQFEQAATALLLCRHMSTQDALREAARLASSPTRPAA